MTWHPTRREALGAALAVGIGSVAACSPDSPTAPSPTHPGGDTMGGDEAATRDPSARLQWGAPLQLSPDGQVVAALGFGEVIFWRTSTGRISTRTALEVDVSEASSHEPWSWMGPVIALKSPWNSSTANLVDATTGEHISEVRVTEAGEVISVSDMTLSPDGSLLVSGLGDGTIRVHATADGKEVRRVAVKDVKVSDAGTHPPVPSFTHDGTLVLSSHLAQCPVQFWSGDGSHLLRIVPEVPLPYHHFQITPDGTRCAVIRKLEHPVKAMEVELRNGDTAELIHSHALPTLATFVALHPAGTHFAWCGGEGNRAEKSVIHVMDLETSEVAQLLGHKSPPRSLRYTPDGKTLLSLASGAGIHAWDHSSDTLRQVFEFPS